MSSILYELIYKVANAELRTWPFPHVLIENFLPIDFYNDMVEAWPENMRPIAESRPTSYKDRAAWSPFKEPDLPAGFWRDLVTVFGSEDYSRAWLYRFMPFIKEQYGDSHVYSPDALVMQDRADYALGPHTDIWQKAITHLIYAPTGDREIDYDTSLGTSGYVAVDGFECDGSAHHPRDMLTEDGRLRFQEVVRAPYQPNTLFAFCKTNTSFHGVERVPTDAHRRLLLWNLRTAPNPHGGTPSC